MLNQLLFDQLEAAYMDVTIHDEDHPLTLKVQPSSDFARGHSLSDYRITSNMIARGGEYYAVNCPFCGDCRQRLWVCHAWGSVVNLNGMHIPVSRGIVHCYNEMCLKVSANWNEFCLSLSGDWKPPLVEQTTRPDKAHEITTVPFPASCYVNDPHADAVVQDYLVDRGYDLDELATQWDFRIGKIDFYDQPAVLMPVCFNNQYAFWQARYPIKGQIPELFRDGRRKPKYYIPAGARKSMLLYNFDRACLTDTIVLVEGIFDAARIGPSGVAMFGKKPSYIQEQLIAMAGADKRVIWIPDQDDQEAIDAAMAYTEMWNLRGVFAGGAHMLTLKEGDPAEFTREELWELIRQSVGR